MSEFVKKNWKWLIAAIVIILVVIIVMRTKKSSGKAGAKTASKIDPKEMEKLKATLAKCKDQEKVTRLAAGAESPCKKLEEQIKKLEG